MLNEFEIIKKYFFKNNYRADVVLKPGDDCALLKMPADQLLAISIDTLVENTHFFPTIPAEALGYKALAVNLSDLAAMGATPAWVTMALTLPEVNEIWLEKFSQGFFNLADEFQVDLVGGNLSKGPLAVTVQVHGFLPRNQALKRNAAKIGDLIFVSGELGAAGAALLSEKNEITISTEQKNELLNCWYYPKPKIELGKKLLNIAHAAIDISDGLLADLQHILTASQVGAEIHLNQIPVYPLLHEIFSAEQALDLALSAGEDYQLCFTVPENKIHLLPQTGKITCIGKITAGSKLLLNEKQVTNKLGYQHF